jgi:hypothetical protein
MPADRPTTMSLRSAFRRFLYVETPLSMLVIVPVVFIAAALSDVAAPATPLRLALSVIPLTVPFIPLRWHMFERAWLRPSVIWMIVTVVPAMALSLVLGIIAG